MHEILHAHPSQKLNRQSFSAHRYHNEYGFPALIRALWRQVPGILGAAMQFSEKLVHFVRERKVILIRVFVALFLIVAVYAVAFLHPADDNQRSYDVDVTAGVMLPGGSIDGKVVTTPIITILVKGGKDVADLKSLTISINNKTAAEMNPEGKATLRWLRASQDFPVQDPNGNHVVATGHFSNGKNIVLLDTTV